MAFKALLHLGLIVLVIIGKVLRIYRFTLVVSSDRLEYLDLKNILKVEGYTLRV